MSDHGQTPDLETLPPPRGLRMAGIAAGAVAALVIVGGLVARSSESSAAAQWSTAQAAPTVHLVQPAAAGATRGLDLPGTMQAWNSAHIYARVPGYICAWYRDIGAEVGTGTPLGAIDTPELDQQIVQARAALARARADAVLARSTAARWADLLTTASVSRQEADEKNAAALTRQAAVNEAAANLGRLVAMKGYATLRAPFAGVVTQRSADIGDLVGPGATNPQPLFALADEHRIRTYVSVPQAYAAAMRSGLTATLTVPDQPGRTFAARIVGTSSAINAASGALQVQLVSDNPGEALHAGGYAQVHFALPGQPGLVTVPASALLLRAGGSRVATVTPQGRIHLLPVTIGRDLGTAVEINAGIPAGTAVVDNPPDSLVEGETVHVDKKA